MLHIGFNEADSSQRMMKAFGPGSPYNNPSPQSYSKGMKDMSIYPIKSKWRTYVLNRFVQYYPSGITLENHVDEDTNVDPDSIVRLVPLVALYAGRPDMLEMAEKAALQLQVNDMVITVTLAACRIVEQFILGEGRSCEEHLRAVIAELKSPSRAHPQSLDLAVAGHLQRALDTRDMDVTAATAKFGKA